MRRKISILVLTIILSLGMIGLSACKQKHVHDYSTQEVVAPTCTEQGYTKHVCSCGEEQRDNFVDALGHDMGDYVQTEDPTCSKVGKEQATCKRQGCEHVITRDVQTLDHEYSEQYSYDELFHWFECSCGDKMNLSVHDLMWVEDKPATEEESGLKHRECMLCGYKTDLDTEIPNLGHTHDFGEEYLYDDQYHWMECRCHAQTNFDVHVLEWVEDKPASKTEVGLKHRECITCGYKTDLNTVIPMEKEDGFIYISLGQATGKPTSGLHGSTIAAQAGETVFLPNISCLGLIFVGYQIVETGEMITDKIGGQFYIYNFDGNALELVAIWIKDPSFAVGPEIEL